jgi:hypothetical protein
MNVTLHKFNVRFYSIIRNPVLKKFMLKNLQQIPFGEGQVQDPIPALPGHGSQISAVLLGDR